MSEYTTSHPAGQRALEDILSGERMLRELSESTARGLRDVLTEVGFRLGGERLELLRRDDPSAPANWAPAAWRQFFAGIRIPEATTGWGTPVSNSEGEDPEKQALQAEIDRLRQELSQTRAQVHAVKMAHPVAMERPEKPKRPTAPVERQKAAPEAKNLVIPQSLEPFISQLKQLEIPKRPAQYAEMLSTDEARYNRQVRAIWLAARFGFNPRLLYDAMISAVDGLSVKTGSVRRPVEDLCESGVLVTQSMMISEPIQTALALVRLSAEGKALAKMFGWEPVESGWERVLRSHRGQERYILMTQAFCLHAQLRGYQPQVLPEVEAGGNPPDVLLEKDGATIWVTMEPSKKNLARLGQASARAGANMALCAIDATGREQLVAESRKQNITHGYAADLSSLIFNGQERPAPLMSVTPDMPLWVDTW